MKKITGSTCPVLTINKYKEFERKKINYELKKTKITRTIPYEITSIIKNDDIENFKIMFKEINLEKQEILHKCAEDNAIEIIDFLLKKEIDVNKLNSSGYSPLHIAVMKGNLKVVKKLIEKGADIEEVEPEYYLNSLYLALNHEKYGVAIYLLRNGAQVYKKNNKDELIFLSNFVMEKILQKEMNDEIRSFLNILTKAQH